MTGIRSEQHSPVINVPTGSAEVSTANAKARATLPTFWASYEASKPSETGHSLKVRFSNKTNDGGHIRMAEVKELADGRYSGRLANEPRYLVGKRVGDLVEFKEADSFDWMFMRDGKIVGGETTSGCCSNPCRRRRRRPPRAPGNAVRQTQENGPRRSGQIPSGRLSDWLATMRRVG
jgi:uncharacterized protein YegJ (DUF2314 family)